MRTEAIFGPGGNSKSFYETGYTSTLQAPAFVKNLGLGAYEFEAGNGITAKPDTLRAIGEAAKVAGVEMSLHAPYYISLSGVEEEKRLKSVEYILRSLEAATALGADTIVIHTGSAAKISRDEALALARDTLERTLDAVGDTPIALGLETMGKINQLGTLPEVISLCKIDKRLAPVVDFGHINARERGTAFPDADSFRRVFDAIGSELSADAAKYLHCHFSKIEYTDAGEKRHLTFADEVYGPRFEPLAEAIVREGVCPRIICESSETMAEDALTMQHLYRLAQKANGAT